MWHVAHQNTGGDDGGVRHLDGGEVHVDERDGDGVKLLGVYSTRTKAADRMASARLLPGFADEPECFIIDEHTLDHDAWAEGFESIRLSAGSGGVRSADDLA